MLKLNRFGNEFNNPWPQRGFRTTRNGRFCLRAVSYLWDDSGTITGTIKNAESLSKTELGTMGR
jgi:hypothetical protein